MMTLRRVALCSLACAAGAFTQSGPSRLQVKPICADALDEALADEQTQYDDRGFNTGGQPFLVRQVKMGVVCLDYKYKTNMGDILDRRSHDFDLVSARVKGLTFDLCKFGQDEERWPGFKGQPGDLPDDVEASMNKAVRKLLDAGADFISGDCGFMFYYQILIRSMVRRWAEDNGVAFQPPVMMSSLNLLPNMIQTVPPKMKIVVLTAEKAGLVQLKDNFGRVYQNQLRKEAGNDDWRPIFDFRTLANDTRLVIKGLDEVREFDDAVNKDPENFSDRRHLAEPVAEMCRDMIEENPNIACFLIECTEAYGFSTAIQIATGRPVFTGNTMCHTLSMGFRMQFVAAAFTPRVDVSAAASHKASRVRKQREVSF